MTVMVPLGLFLLEHKIPLQSETTFDLFAKLSLEARKQARSCIALGTRYLLIWCFSINTPFLNQHQIEDFLFL